MNTLGNLKIYEPEEDKTSEAFYWDCENKKYEKYPLYERYIKSEITKSEYLIHKNEFDTKNCYFCKHTQNGIDEGTLSCTKEDSSLFTKNVTNLQICESFEKISEINDY